MKLSTLLIATSVIVISNASFASINLNSSKSNAPVATPPTTVAEKACIAGGGKIETDKNGKKFCVKQTPETPSKPTTLKPSK